MILMEDKHRTTMFPVFMTIMFLSIEHILSIILNFLIENCDSFNSGQRAISNIYKTILVDFIVQLFCIIFILIYIHHKDHRKENKEEYELCTNQFIVVTLLLFVGVINFLREVLKELIQKNFHTIGDIDIWFTVALTKKIMMDYNYVFIFFLVFVILNPIFEELLFRKVIINALKQLKINYGWIIVISSFLSTFPFLIVNLVNYSEAHTLWSLTIQIIIGIFLAFLYLRTDKIGYPILLKLVLNFTIIINYFSKIHPIFLDFRQDISFFFLIINLCSILLFLIILVREIKTIKNSILIPHEWINYVNNFQKLNNYHLKTLFYGIFLFCSVFPFGLSIIIDHTIIYNDFEGSLIRTITKVFLLVITITISFILLREPNHSAKKYSRIEYPSIFFLSDYYKKLKNDLLLFIENIPNVVIFNLVMIIFITGIVAPLFIISMSSKSLIQVLVFFWADTEYKIVFGMSPFLSYAKIITEVQSVIVFFGYRKSKDEYIYVLKHINGKWVFLPDTFMSNPSDWLHGILTVMIWFLLIFLILFAVFNYSKRRKLITGVIIIGTLVTEIVWILLVLGYGSNLGEEPSPSSSLNQTASYFIDTKFKLISFDIFPLGMIILLMATVVLLIISIYEKIKLKNMI